MASAPQPAVARRPVVAAPAANPPGGSRVARPQRGPSARRPSRRVVIDTAASRPQRDTRQRGRRGRGEHRTERREEVPAPTGPATVRSGVTVKDLAAALGISTAQIQKIMMGLGELVGITQTLTNEAVEMIGAELEREITITSAADEVTTEETFDDAPEDLVPRAPVVTIMGHVDHGKTSLLDAIRETSVVSGEAGGITQHIGAYQAIVGDDGRAVTFLDTPGHEAFTAMRARAGRVTDVVVLVVAADDGVMPQTVEAIDHAKAAEVPIVVAVNKIDRPDANPERVRTELTTLGLQPEEWGGSTIFVDVSAKERTGLHQLLEMLLLQADILELKANPKADAQGVVIESRLDIGRGPIATVLVQRGTLGAGVALVAGDAWGKVRALEDDHGRKTKEAGPSVPVEVLGFDHPPPAGERFRVVESERVARQEAQQRAQRLREEQLARRQKSVSLEQLFSQIKEGGARELNLVIKADVQGSVEAAIGEVEKIKHSEVSVRVIRTGVGGIAESDVMLAAASKAIVVGFNVRPNAEAKAAAEREGVDVRTYRVIYQLTEDIQKALVGMLTPDQVEEVLGEAEVRATFRASRLGVICGCMVTSGVIQRNGRVRLVREGAVVWEGNIASLRRVQEDVREVAQGLECGILLENYNDAKVGDTIECFVTRQVERTTLDEPAADGLIRSAVLTRRRARGERDARGAVGALAHVALDERVAVELRAHGGAHGAGAAPVHDLDLGQAREVGVVDELAHGFARLVGALAAQVEQARRVRHRRRPHAHRGLGVARRPRALGVGLELLEGHVHAHRPALDERHAVDDLGDHAAQAERPRAHGVAGLRARASGAPARRAPRRSRVRRRWRVRVGGAEPAVAVGLGRAFRRTRSLAPPALLAARRAQLLAQRLELAAVRGEVALRVEAGAFALLGDGRLAPRRRRRAAPARGARLLAQRRRLAALHLGLGAQPHRGLLGARGLAQQALRLDALRRESRARSLDHAARRARAVARSRARGRGPGARA